MAFRELRYFSGEAIKSIIYNPLMTLASVITVTGCLLFLGVFMLFSVNLSFIADQVQEDCKLVAYIESDYSDAATTALKDRIMGVTGVRDAELETQKQAFENAGKMLRDAGVSLEGMEDDSFMRASYTITVENLENSAQIAEALRTITGIEEVREQQDITDKVFSATEAIKVALIIAMCILALIAVFIIANSIKLAVFAREREIHIMKYVGATDWFIRWPFIIEGIIVGALGAAISLVICLSAYGYVAGAIKGFLNAFDLRTTGELVWPLTLLLLFFGAAMGAIGSGIAVRRHLKV